MALLCGKQGFGAYTFYRQITLDHTKVSGSTQTDFPVEFKRSKGTVNTLGTAITRASGDLFSANMVGAPISINGTIYTVSGFTNTSLIAVSSTAGTQTGVVYFDLPYLAQVADGGSVQNASGYDIVFASNTSCSTLLDFESEVYSSTGQLIFWVKVPTLSNSSDTTLYLCYDNSSISTSQENVSGTWSNSFVGVWHLPDGTTLTLKNSVDNVTGTNHSAGATTGQIDGAASFVKASTQYIDAGGTYDLTVPFTIESWENNTGGSACEQNTTRCVVIGNEQPSNKHGYVFGNMYHSGDSCLYLEIVDNSGNLTGVAADRTSTSMESVAAVATTSHQAGMTIYKNGAAAGTPGSCANFLTDNATAVGTSSNNAQIGSFPYSATVAEYFSGTLDEVRISSVARSADWIATEYNNQSSWATFASFGGASTPTSASVRHRVTQNGG